MRPCSYLLVGLLLHIAVNGVAARNACAEPVAAVWVSSEDMTKKLTREGPMTFVPDDGSSLLTVGVDASRTYQSVLGMGSSLEHSTCFNISKLDSAGREKVIESLVNPDWGIGMNLMRICIGTSDFTGDPWYSYDDMPPGETDANLEHFSIEKDKDYVIPVLKTTHAKAPELLFFASPWSPPGWMKNSGKMCGGHLLPQYYAVYAQYLAKFVKAYEAEGIPIYAITVQNEPGVSTGKYPSCRWSGAEQRDFIKNHLGPAFRQNGIATKIWCFDHNFNNLPFPRAILSDSDAAQYADGTGFHFYEGTPDAMTVLHTEFPNKNIYFTEGSTFRTYGALRIISFFRNWAQSYNAWVTMLDQNGKPNNGPFRAGATCIVMNSDDLTLNYRFDHYMYGQFMKFVKRGAVRIYSDEGSGTFGNVAFKNPDGTIVLIGANADAAEIQFKVASNGLMIKPTLGARSVATYVWHPN